MIDIHFLLIIAIDEFRMIIADHLAIDNLQRLSHAHLSIGNFEVISLLETILVSDETVDSHWLCVFHLL